MKTFIINKLHGIIKYYLIGSLLMVILGCGNSNDAINPSSSGIGSISFDIAWDDGVSNKSDDGSVILAIAPSGDVCDDYSISTINCKVYNASNVEVASSSWSCSSHQGTMTSVPAGSGMRLTLDGIVSGSVAWTGEQTGITVSSGQSTNAGTVNVSYIGNNTDPPSITLISPLDSAVDVATNATISVTFQESVVAASVNTSTFTLYNGSTQISGVVQYSSSNNTATFNPDSNLINGITYTATITAGVQSISGVQMTGDYSWSFTPFALPDTGQIDIYSSIFGEDSDYTINSPSFTDNGDGTVSDNNTGMMWQQEDDNSMRGWTDAISYCEELVLGTGSLPDWRLPTYNELFSILDYAGPSPAIDTSVFPGTDNTGELYWTSSDPVQSSSNEALSIYFAASGFTWTIDKTTLGYVRCVRGNVFPSSDFTDNSDGTVTDNATGLMWQQNEAGTGVWEDAIDYCENILTLAGYSDWRLPNIKELETLLDFSRISGPAINTAYFPNAMSDYYWSSTAYFDFTDAAADIDFSSTSVNTLWTHSMTDIYNVRCVR